MSSYTWSEYLFFLSIPLSLLAIFLIYDTLLLIKDLRSRYFVYLNPDSGNRSRWDERYRSNI